MTEIQQGAKSAIAPAMIAASNEPPKKMLLLITAHHFQEAETRRPAISLLTVRSALPVPLVSGMGHCLSFGDNRNFRPFHLGDLASEVLLLGLHIRHAGLQCSQVLIACQTNRRQLFFLLLRRLPGGYILFPCPAAFRSQQPR